MDNGFHFSGTHTREGNGLVPCESESHSVMPDSLQPHGLYRPWNSPGQNTGVGSLSLLQGIFPTQGLNPGLQSCRQILYQLSYQGSPALRKVHIHFFKKLDMDLPWLPYRFTSVPAKRGRSHFLASSPHGSCAGFTLHVAAGAQ